MKKIYRMLTFAVALTLTFVLAGCGKTPDPVEQDLTTAQVVDLISNLIDLEDLDFTATANAEYTFSMKDGEDPRQTQSDEYENVVVKFADGKNYISVPGVMEQYAGDDWSYLKDLETNKYRASYHNSQDYDSTYLDYTSGMETIVKEMYSNLVSYNPSWLSSTKLTSGAYKLSLNANLQPDLVTLQEVLVNYADSTLEELINSIMQIHYGSQFSISNLVTAVKTQVTSTSTLGDVLTFVKNTFGFDISQTYSIVSSILTDTEGIEMPTLDTNFFGLVEIESNEAFATMIDNFVLTYLQNDEFTLSAFLESEGGAKIKGIYDTFVGLDINTLQIIMEIVTNADKTQIEYLNLTANGDVTMGTQNYQISALGSIHFTDIGSTVINFPTINSTNVDDLYLGFEFSNSDLTASTAKEISDMMIGTTNYVFSTGCTDDELVTLTYNSTTHKLILSAQTINYLLSEGDISFYDSTNNVNVYFEIVE